MSKRKAKSGAARASAAKAAVAPASRPAPKAAAPAAPQPAKVAAETIAKTVAAETTKINPSTQPRTETMTNDAVKTANDTAKKTLDTAVETGKVANERMQAAYGEANERAKLVAEKGGKMLEEASELTKGNVEALVAASKIAAKGFETLSQEAAEFGRKSFEEASATMKSFAEVRSPADMFRIQSEFAKSQFDSMVAESSKMSEQVIKLMGDVAEPLTNRYSVAAERAKAMAA